ncbi:DMT family transporter [Candidatus Methylacidithermus pantelleriae]|nr:DMT family transporter [Candidatus Methylacidithermus pantelleriae]
MTPPRKHCSGFPHRSLLASDRFFLVVLTVLWATPALFMYYLLRYFDPCTQNFYRYTVGFLTTLPWGWKTFRAQRVPWRRAFLPCLVAAFPNAFHQIAQTEALKGLPPGTLTVLLRLSVPLTALLAFWHLPDERPIVRQASYWTGLALALCGTAGLVVPENSTFRVNPLCLGWALGASLAWSLYTVFAKQPSDAMGPVASFTWISGLTSVLLFFPTLLIGRPSEILHAPVRATVLLVVSAVLCIGLGHVLYYTCITRLGAVVAVTVQFLCPLGTLLLSRLLFGERLGWIQWGWALVLLLGSWMSTFRRADPVNAQT